ncbi:hypothetical protein AD998_06605 [bacterium 336/3]|nr:hypothetical protein AD998_06605 [bacterium 336/3]
MNQKCLLIYLFVCCITFVNAQNTKLDSLLDVLKTSKEDTNQVKVLYRISDIFRGKSQNERALEYTKKSLELSKKLRFEKFEANNYGILGIIYTNLGNYQEALTYHKKSLFIKAKITDKQGVGNSYNNIGDVYYQLGNYAEALVYHFKALKIREELGNKISIANSYNNIGSTYNLQKNYEESLKYHFLSLKIMEELKEKASIARSYNNIAINYNALKKHQEALIYQQKAILLQEETNNKKGRGITLGNIGSTYHYLENYEKANEYYEKSLKLREEIKDKYGIAVMWRNIANVCIKQKKYKEAKAYLDKSMVFSKEMNSLEDFKHTYFIYSTLYKEESNYEASLDNYKKYIVYRDSIFNVENDKKSMKAQIQYEFEKQQAITEAQYEKQQAIKQAEFEKQNILNHSKLEQQQYILEKQQQSYLILEQADKLKSLNLTKSNLELKQSQTEKEKMQLSAKKDAEQSRLIIIFVSSIAFLMFLILFVIIQSLITNKKKNAIIAQNLIEKETLLKEIHHRVKNNLQIISSLLNLQSRYIDDSKAIEAINESKERINAISLLHKEIYQTEALSIVNANTYFTNLSKNLQNTFDSDNSRQLILKIEELYLDIDVLIPLGLIANELVTNAFKYGINHNNSIIEFMLETIDNQVSLTIKDNGQGFPNNFEPSKQNSLGVKLISLFAKKLNASVEYFNNSGACVQLKFIKI